jgi:hypothetical protein
MRHFFVLPVIILAAPSAWAQVAPGQNPAPIQQEASVTPYYAQPYYVPPVVAPVAPAPARVPAAPQPSPSDYGQSVITDIRQMNF